MCVRVCVCVCVCVCVGPKVLVLTFVQCLKDESVSVLTRLIEIGGIKSSSLKKVRIQHCNSPHTHTHMGDMCLCAYVC